MPAAGVSGVDKPQILAFVIAKALSARRGVAIGRLDQIANKRNPLSYLFLTSPAKAGAQLRPARYWAPAFAGEVFGRSARIGLHAIRLGPVDIQPMPACKWRFPALPVLPYPKYPALREIGKAHV